MEGGYQVIDLKNIVINVGVAAPPTEVTIPGIYSAIESTRKALLLTNLVTKSDSDSPVERRDSFCSTKVQGSNFVLPLPDIGISLFVNDDDEIYGAVWMVAGNQVDINNTLEVDVNGQLGVASN